MVFVASDKVYSALNWALLAIAALGFPRASVRAHQIIRRRSLSNLLSRSSFAQFRITHKAPKRAASWWK